MTPAGIVDVTDWLRAAPACQFVPLFSEVEPLQVRIKSSGARRILCRSGQMEAAMIDIVEAGLTRPDWEGLLYVMGWGPPDAFRVLYVGKAERKGVKHPVSANIANIRSNLHKFARWGDGIAYHMGDLSHALFGFESYKAPSPKYRRWAETLFACHDPPILKEPVYLSLLPWYVGMKGPSGFAGALAGVEKEVIALAGWQFADIILNRDGV
jgi:hypothetical protein